MIYVRFRDTNCFTRSSIQTDRDALCAKYFACGLNCQFYAGGMAQPSAYQRSAWQSHCRQRSLRSVQAYVSVRFTYLIRGIFMAHKDKDISPCISLHIKTKSEHLSPKDSRSRHPSAESWNAPIYNLRLVLRGTTPPN